MQRVNDAYALLRSKLEAAENRDIFEDIFKDVARRAKPW